MIFITKTTQILEVLYPNVIPTSEFGFVATAILPDIKKLVDMVDTPQIHEVQLEESKYSVQCTSAPLPENLEPKTSAHDIKHGELIGIENKKDVVTCYNQTFTEHEKHLVDDSWSVSSYGGSAYVKKSNNIQIKGDGCLVNTSWEYLNDYYQSLPDVNAIIHIDGLNKKKQKTLAKFYEDHPNFQCHVGKHDGLNSLIKDEVHVNTQTNHDDAGTVDPEHYDE